MEQADRIAAAADAGGDRIGQAAVLGQHLLARFAADDGVEVAHHARIRMRAGHGADDVEGVLHVGHPVAHRFVERVLQGGRAGSDRHHRRAQQLHAVDVDLLPLDVGGAHVDHAFQAQPRGNGGAGHAMLAGAGLGDDALLAHARGQQAWPMVLLILCAPVWFRSSRLSRICAPPTCRSGAGRGRSGWAGRRSGPGRGRRRLEGRILARAWS
jgi:hypothetical protein